MKKSPLTKAYWRPRVGKPVTPLPLWARVAVWLALGVLLARLLGWL